MVTPLPPSDIILWCPEDLSPTTGDPMADPLPPELDATRDFLPMRGELHGEAGTEPAALLAPEEPPPPPLPPGLGTAPGAPAAPGPLGTTPPSISC